MHGRLSLSLSDRGENQHTVSTISRGEFVGWSALFPDMVEDGTTRAVKASKCIRFEARHLLEACERTPAFGFELTRFAFRSALHRLYDCHLQLVDLYGQARGQSVST
jgi:CRP-like cAMP-binding protein